jgi:hypothetical protein
LLQVHVHGCVRGDHQRSSKDPQEIISATSLRRPVNKSGRRDLNLRPLDPVRSAPTPGRWIRAKSRSEIPPKSAGPVARGGRGDEQGKHWESTQHAQGEHTVAVEGTASPQRKDAEHLCPRGGHPTERELGSGRALRKHAEGMPEIRRPRFEHRRVTWRARRHRWTAKCASSLARRPLQR